ncbi:MAG: hypothetical protein KatS3mg035_1978 [Bacteroidia bacterium]|nr:MAG: hypothetical protein KatS3mg035_1978 [Bacteroidia bacterium]
MKKGILILFFLFTLLLVADAAIAQCAMCKATIETDASDVGKGVNNAILYIMVMPYILLAIIAIIFFRKKIAAKFTI